MPSRAVTSFLRYRTMFDKAGFAVVSMPSRAVTSFLRTIAPNPRGLEPLSVNALSGCYLISTDQIRDGNRGQHFVSMPSRAVTSFLRSCDYNSYSHRTIVSMPSRAVTSFLLRKGFCAYGLIQWRCQCPLGLLPHFYKQGVHRISRA